MVGVALTLGKSPCSCCQAPQMLWRSCLSPVFSSSVCGHYRCYIKMCWLGSWGNTTVAWNKFLMHRGHSTSHMGWPVSLVAGHLTICLQLIFYMIISRTCHLSVMLHRSSIRAQGCKSNLFPTTTLDAIKTNLLFFTSISKEIPCFCPVLATSFLDYQSLSQAFHGAQSQTLTQSLHFPQKRALTSLPGPLQPRAHRVSRPTQVPELPTEPAEDSLLDDTLITTADWQPQLPAEVLQ